MPTIKGAGTRN